MGKSDARGRIASNWVMIWDPNGVNPYAGEIAAILGRGGYRVVRWIPRRALGTRVVDYCRDIRLLGTNRPADGLIEHIARRTLAPLLFVIVAVVRRDIAVLCWVRGSYEAVLFTAASKLMRQCVLVDHNPIAGRDTGTSSERITRVLRSSVDKRVVHRAAFVPECNRNTVFIPHPRYILWTEQLGIAPRSPRTSADRPDSGLTILLLGAVRPDKGWAEMHRLFEVADPVKWEFVIVGMGRLPEKCAEVISRRGLKATIYLSNAPVDDRAVADAVSQCDVLLAPYVNATASGTVMLAFSSGLPTLAFKSGALADLLVDRAVVEVNDFEGLGRLISRWQATRFETFRISAHELDREVEKRWREVAASGPGHMPRWPAISRR